MGYSTISIELDICGNEEVFEVDVIWFLDSTNGDLIIEDIVVYYVSSDNERLSSPYWFNHMIDKSRVLYEYEDLIISNGE